MAKLEDFIKESVSIHGDRYVYSKSEYKSTKQKLIIICKEHGEFLQKPEKHKSGQGCPKCVKNKKKTSEEFIVQSNKTHNNKYDYSVVNFSKMATKVDIVCPKHGLFKQTPKEHSNGQGCPKCAGKNKTTEEFIKDSIKVHGDKYSYNLTEFINNETPIKIICSIHGVFEQLPYVHSHGFGCSMCSGNKKSNTAEFINNSIKKHGDKYDYSLVNYKNNNFKVKIICPIHGEFEQSPIIHKNGCGCPRCKGIIITEKKSKSLEEFINEAKEKHGDYYNYSLVNYKNSRYKIKIICPTHGEFEQQCDSHLRGCGCPKCTHVISKSEKEIAEFIRDNSTLEVITTNNNILSPKEIDIFIPSLNIAIEFNELYWHNELHKDSNYHLNKTNECESKGIRLIHIFEDEWINKKEIVKSRLLNILGLTKTKIYGRKCIIKEISSPDAKEFLNNNHIQGYAKSFKKIALYHNEELVSLMTFAKPSVGIGENFDGFKLIRFANKINTSVIGAADKLLKYFINNYKPKEIISYADRRWSQGDLYNKLGFTKTNVSKPNYYYIVNDSRVHKFNFSKRELKKEGFDTINKTEHEIMLERKIFKIYDCGTITYKKTPIN